MYLFIELNLFLGFMRDHLSLFVVENCLIILMYTSKCVSTPLTNIAIGSHFEGISSKPCICIPLHESSENANRNKSRLLFSSA